MPTSVLRVHGFLPVVSLWFSTSLISNHHSFVRTSGICLLTCINLHLNYLELQEKKGKNFIFIKEEKQVFFLGGGGMDRYIHVFYLHDPDDPAIDEFFLSPVRQKSACLLVNIQ